MAHDHDKRYKKLFSHPDMVKELLLYFIDEDFIKDPDCNIVRYFATLLIFIYTYSYSVTKEVEPRRSPGTSGHEEHEERKELMILQDTGNSILSQKLFREKMCEFRLFLISLWFIV